MKARIVCATPFGEGPVWCEDGTLVVCNVAGELYRVWPEDGRAVRIADTRGGANGAAPARGGGFLVTQNGGIDFASLGIFPDPPPCRPAEPGLQYAAPDGAVRYVAKGGFSAPNDLVVASDNTVYFTDPPPMKVEWRDGQVHVIWPDPPAGRVMALRPDGALEVYAKDFVYCNGIGLDRDGHVVVVEAHGLQRVFPDGSREWIVENLGIGGGDGFCVDMEGRFYVAGTVGQCVRVVDPDGRIVEVLETPGGDQIPTNCCFGGADNRTLFAVEMPGRVVCWENMPTPGRPLTPWTPHFPAD